MLNDGNKQSLRSASRADSRNAKDTMGWVAGFNFVDDRKYIKCSIINDE